MEDKLTPKQRLFCEEYVANGYKQIKAYMDAFNASYKNANARSWELMRDERIKKYIEDIQKERFEALHVNADKIATKLAEMAFADKDDEIYTPPIQQKALDMLQRQLGLITNKVEAEVKTTVIDVNLEDE